MHKKGLAFVALACAAATCLPLSASSASSAPASSPCPTTSSAWPSLEVGSQAGSLRRDVTLIAPHGSFDRNTRELALAIGTRISANVVWAVDPKATFVRRINVNRPTEMRWGMDRKTKTAGAVFGLFSDCVARFPSRMSVEIHGDSSKDVMEMATVGVGAEQAVAMKAAWANRFGLPLAVDAAGDKLTMTAGANKRTGLLSRCAAACLHIEVPSHLRDPEVLDATADHLAEFLIAIAP
ncbi:MAG: hypothetical protein WA797_09705 [Acidimicrobiales bacterium]